jgi:hypothetical protein
MPIRTTLLALMAVAVALAAPAMAGAAGSHSCREGDPPIEASARTSCPMAGAIVNAYANRRGPSSGGEWAGRVRSPVTGRRYWIACTRTGGRSSGTVRCRGEGRTGIWARFSSAPF